MPTSCCIWWAAWLQSRPTRWSWTRPSCASSHQVWCRQGCGLAPGDDRPFLLSQCTCPARRLHLTPADVTFLCYFYYFLAGSSGELNPMAATFGGFVGQEVVKALSGKFSPLHQWFYFDSAESMPDDILPAAEYEPTGSRGCMRCVLRVLGCWVGIAQLPARCCSCLQANW
eukprot:GHRQ01037231.1.p1 GENE.GHRQ01037231.1~~GHRQ01037231.1.p1  ORF type:complete len:171 (-),score=14.90 GHRQ01037231.1:207-719(-)